MKTMDIWLRWSYRTNGWEWSILDGATLIEEGTSPSYDDSLTCAKGALERNSAGMGRKLIGVEKMDATPDPAQIKLIRSRQDTFLRSLRTGR